jgi:ATP-binding cassette subfamily F protein 3
LDIHSKDILLDALLQYRGTVIFVSHDRSFMEALSTKTLELKAEKTGAARTKLFYGGYAYYCDRMLNEEGGDSPEPELIQEHPPGEPCGKPRGANRQRRTLIRNLEKQEGECLAELEALEKEKARLEAELARPEVYSSREKAGAVKADLDGVIALLETKTARWEGIALELSEAESCTNR